MLRLKYHHLLPKSGFFRLNNMRIMCSVPERTIMSLQSFMAGFFPPPVHNLNLPILWQPFHFDIDYKGRIVYLNYEYAACPVFVGQAFSFATNPPAELAAWLAADKQAFSDFSVLLGSPINDLQDVIMVSDALKIQIGLDKNMPKWATDAFEKTFRKYGILVKTMSHATPTMIKIRGGPMVTEIVNNMVAVANKAPEAKNLLIYSAHDVTVASLAYALGVESQIPEPISYSDTIMVDLVSRGGGGEMLVEVVYMDNTNVIPRAIYLNVPGCGKSCTLTTFRNAVKGMMVEDFDKLCGLK